MKLFARTWPSAFVGVVLAGLAAAGQTWIVDDNGGAGVDFTDLPPAIAAAVDGDILIVRPGNYSGFVLSEALTIVGESGVNVTSPTTIANLPAGERATIARLTLHNLDVNACAGSVVFEDVQVLKGLFPPPRPALIVQSCADVRFHAALILGLTFSSYQRCARINASRVEFSSCSIDPFPADDDPNADVGAPGGYGVRCEAGSRVHFALTTVRGGDGGDACSGFCAGSGYGGNGGAAIEVDGGSLAIVAGVPSNLIKGGKGGGGTVHGANAPGVLVTGGGALRWSAITIQGGGLGFPVTPPIVLQGGTATQATPPDPTVEISGDSAAGGALTLTFHGVAGTNGRLQQGNMPLVVDDGLATIEKLNNRIRIHPLGQVPANGTIVYPLSVPSNWQPGQFRIFQGLEIDGATALLLERTNSVPVVVH